MENKFHEILNILQPCSDTAILQYFKVYKNYKQYLLIINCMRPMIYGMAWQSGESIIIIFLKSLCFFFFLKKFGKSTTKNR